MKYDIAWNRLKTTIKKEIKLEQRAIKSSVRDKDYSNAFALSNEMDALEYILRTMNTTEEELTNG